MNGAEENIWTQEGGSKGRMVLRGIFGPKREIVKKNGAEGNVWIQEGGSERMIVLRGIFGPKKEEVREG